MGRGVGAWELAVILLAEELDVRSNHWHQGTAQGQLWKTWVRFLVGEMPELCLQGCVRVSSWDGQFRIREVSKVKK